MSIWIVTVLIAVFGTALLMTILRPPTAALLAAVRAGIFFVHHELGVWGPWRLEDDVTYLNQGQSLADSQLSLWAPLLSAEGRELAVTIASSRHYIFGFMNSLAIEAIGPFYWAPVAMNVILSIGAGVALFLLASRLGFRRDFAAVLSSAYVLYPPVVAWSTFVNLKDTAVSLLVIVTFYFVVKLVTQDSRWGRIWSVVTLLLLLLIWYGLRLYIPFLVGASVAFAFSRRLPRPWTGLVTVVVGACTYVGADLLLAREGYDVTLGLASMGNFIRGLMTPQPWSIVDSYSFLIIPSLVHWILLPFFLLGIIALYRLPTWGPVLVAFTVFTLLIGVVAPAMQGPRQRFQIEFILIACQIAGLYMASRLHRGYLLHPRNLLVTSDGEIGPS